jgi:hypothetical protein
MTQGVDAGAYYHELFLRVRPSLCHRMIRQKVKGTGHKQPADVKTEPNFYEMSFATNVSISDPSMQPQPSLSQSVADIPGRSSLGYSEYSLSSSLSLRPDHSHVEERHESSLTFESEERDMQNTHVPADSVLDSPGLQCAAHLLQGIASGYTSNKLRIPASDALSAGLEGRTFSDGVSSDQLNEDGRRSIGFLKPRLSNEFR